MTDKKNHIADLLNVTPTIKENGVVVYQEAADSDIQVEEDINYVRSMMYDTIATTKDALDKILEIAKQSQHPRAFEVVAGLLNTMREANKDLLGLHKTKKEIRGSDRPDGPDTVNNNLFVGTTSELMDLIKNGNR